jgi:hypothetical protein
VLALAAGAAGSTLAIEAGRRYQDPVSEPKPPAAAPGAASEAEAEQAVPVTAGMA